MNSIINYIIENKKEKESWFDYFSIVFSFLIYGLQKVIVLDVADYILYSILIIFGFINLFRSKITTQKLLCYFFLMLIGTISFIYTRNITLIKIAAMAMALSNCSLNSVLKYGFYTQIFFFIIIFTFSLFGFNYEYSLLPIDSTRNIRYSLGFNHPNTAASYLLYTIFLYYLYKKRPPLQMSLFLLLLSVVVFYLTDSRTSFFITLIFFFLIFISYIFKVSKNFLYFVTFFSFLFFTIVSLLFSTVFYSSYISSLLSGRLEYSNQVITNYSIQLITNQKIDIILDNAYINLLYKLGILIYFIIALIYIGSTFLFIKNNNVKNCYKITIIFFCLCLSGLVETYILNPNLIIPFFLYAFKFFEKKKKYKVICIQYL